MLLLSPEDHDLYAYKWHLNNGYARFRINRKRFYVHKVVAERMGIVGIVDHINRVPLDCRRDNLRPASTSQNNANQCGHRDRVYSQYKGVTRGKYGKWRSQISVNGKSVNLGSYDDEVVAAKAYDSAAMYLFKEFAVCNFISAQPKSPQLLALEARCLQNQWGYPGISLSKKHGTFKVYKIGVRKYETVGSYKTLDEAIKASKAANPGV